MKHKTKSAGKPHPAAVGLQHVMRTIPADKRSDAMRELKRTSGMGKASMLEHIGNRLLHGFADKGPSQEELDAQHRLAKLKL